jgi:LuxR family transcriptional regulator, maltose regulon positive regulatory protein
MDKTVPWHIIWDSHNACYLLSEQIGQDRTPVPLDAESDRWWRWLEQVPSFAFHSKDGEHFATRQERQARGGVYWTAYRKMNGRLKQKYLGTPQEVTLARLEEMATTLAEPEIATTSPLPPAAPLSTSFALHGRGGNGLSQGSHGHRTGSGEPR